MTRVHGYFSFALLLSLGSLACSHALPPAEPSPVYAKDVGANLEPLPVHRLSIDEPQAVAVEPTAEQGAPALKPATKKNPPKATQPDATQPDATQPDATQPDATQPDATQPDATQPDATQPESTTTEESTPLKSKQ